MNVSDDDSLWNSVVIPPTLLIVSGYMYDNFSYFFWQDILYRNNYIQFSSLASEFYM